MDNITISTIGISATTFTAGYLIGLAAKKIMSLIATIMGVFLLALVGLQSIGIVTIHWDALSSLFIRLVEMIYGVVDSTTVATTLASLGFPFVLGLALGLKSGGDSGLMLKLPRSEDKWIGEEDE